MSVVAETTAPRIPKEQKFWLVLHWFALLQTVYLAVVGVLGGVPAYSELILILAMLATVLAVFCGMRIARLRVTTQQFVKWTTTGRVIAVGWTFIGIVLTIVPIVGAFVELDVQNEGWTSGVIGAVGSVSFLAMIGPGYSDYREALASVKDQAAADSRA